MTHATVHVMTAEQFVDAPLTHLRCSPPQCALETGITGHLLLPQGGSGRKFWVGT